MKLKCSVLLLALLVVTPVFAVENSACNSSMCDVIAAANRLAPTIVGQTKAFVSLLNKFMLQPSKFNVETIALLQKLKNTKPPLQKVLNQTQLLAKLPAKMPPQFADGTNLVQRQQNYTKLKKQLNNFAAVLNQFAKAQSITTYYTRYGGLCGSDYDNSQGNKLCNGYGDYHNKSASMVDASILLDNMTYSKEEAQDALNVIGVMGHYGYPYVFLSPGDLKTLKKANKLNTPLAKQYRALMRSYIATLSMGLSDLYYVYSRHLPIKDLGDNIPKAYSNSHNISLDAFYNYMAKRRLGSSQWMKMIETATPTQLKRQKEFLLVEIQHELALNQALQARMLATNSVFQVNAARIAYIPLLTIKGKSVNSLISYVKANKNADINKLFNGSLSSDSSQVSQKNAADERKNPKKFQNQFKP